MRFALPGAVRAAAPVLALVLGGVPACGGSGASDMDASHAPADATAGGATGDAAATDAGGVPSPARLWSFFNWPRAHGGSDPTITRELVRMIDATPADATIRGNFFILDLPEVASALNAAYDRGVTVRISLDGSPGNRSHAAARSVDGHMGTSAGFCGGTNPSVESVGCITTAVGGIAHIKFMTFSETVAPDGVLYPDVVWFGSYNANGSSGDDDSNNATEVYDSAIVYQALYRHQIRMQNQIHYPGNDYYDRSSGRGYFADPGAGIEGHLSPEQDTNLVLDQLDRIDPDPSCVIRVFQAAIGDSMLPSIDKLVALQNKVDGARRGCQVFVLTDVIGPRCEAALAAAGIELRHITAVHDKLFLIDARFDGSAENRRVVFAGSHNWAAKSSYGNDELLVGIEDGAQWQAFYQHFLDAWHAATR